MTDQPNPAIPDLIAALESEDAFERREAQAELHRLTHQTLGFGWSDSTPEREAAVARWKAWWKGRRGGAGSSVRRSKTIDVHGSLVGLDQLKNALKGIPPEQLEAHLAQILQKMQESEAARSRCEKCGETRATVHVTEKDTEGLLRLRNLCEECARHQGELPG